MSQTPLLASTLLWCHRLPCVTPSELWLHRPDSLTLLAHTDPKIPKGNRPYHEPRSLLDVFGGDSQEQDGNKSEHQQRDGDDRMSGALSHEVKVRRAALLL